MRSVHTIKIVLLIGLLPMGNIGATGQSAQTSAPPQETPRFRVATDGVRIDAVVTDRDGQIVPDLTAADFEVRQDGKIQELLFAQFVPVISGPAPAAVSSSNAVGTAPAAPLARPTAVKREDVQRTLAIVVDDLGLSFESLKNTQKALHAFVDRELRATDLVTLVRTGGSIGSLQSFTTDRRVLHSAIDRLRWNGASRSGVEPFAPVNTWATFDDRHGMGDTTDFNLVEQVRTTMSAAGTLGALNLVVRGARDLPGRKAIIFVSEGFQILARGPHDQGSEPDSRLRHALDGVIDQATRAGVVIYSLDCRGLQAGALKAGDNLKSGPLQPDGMDGLVRSKAEDRLDFNRDTQEGMAYLAEQTGGFAVMNTNSLASGLGRITNDVRDYYVIGYAPAEGTFVAKGKKPKLHKISVRVKRPGLQVKTRKEFLGVSDPEDSITPATPAQQLVRTAISPFAATDIALRATTLPGYSEEQGAFVRVLLHIDARALTFTESEGKKAASADVLGMVFDQDGTEVAHLSTGFAVALTSEGEQDALRDGLAYTLRIPIRQPGGYQLRFAVRDRQSGALGTAGEFLEVPDVARGTFSLSGIVLRSAETVPSGVSDQSDQVLLTPAQALRIYPPGSRLSYAYEIYNATTPVKATMSIWRGAERVLAVAPDTLVPPAGAERVFAAGGGIKLGEGLPAGSYVLEIAAALPGSTPKGKNSTAVQRIDFEVR
jgi:VWFA-related protein